MTLVSTLSDSTTEALKLEFVEINAVVMKEHLLMWLNCLCTKNSPVLQLGGARIYCDVLKMASMGEVSIWG